jgi:hypothetical protein
MIVPPGTLASAAAVTLASASPVRTVSSLLWWPNGCCELGAVAGAVAAVEGAVVVVLPVAALAIP